MLVDGETLDDEDDWELVDDVDDDLFDWLDLDDVRFNFLFDLDNNLVLFV
jgi:hypothetical protein